MRNIYSASALAILFSVSSISSAQEVVGGEQIANLLVGNTLQADYQEAGETRHTFYEFFSPDGKIFGQDKRAEQASGYTKYLGTWEVKDGQFCANLGYGHRGGCSVFEKISEDNYVRKFDGFEVDHVKVFEGRYHP